MNKKEILQKSIEALEKDRDDLNKEIRTRQQILAEKLCPFKVGDRIRGHGNVYEIFEIYPNYSNNNGFQLRGSQIRKDGTLFKKVTRLYNWIGDWEKV